MSTPLRCRVLTLGDNASVDVHQAGKPPWVVTSSVVDLLHVALREDPADPADDTVEFGFEFQGVERIVTARMTAEAAERLCDLLDRMLGARYERIEREARWREGTPEGLDPENWVRSCRLWDGLVRCGAVEQEWADEALTREAREARVGAEESQS